MIEGDGRLRQALIRKVGQPIRMWKNLFNKVLLITLASFMILACSVLPPFFQIKQEVPTPTPTPTPSPKACLEGMVLAAERVCLDIYEVTNGKYKECVETGPCSEPDKTNSIARLDKVYYGNAKYDNYPVIRVTWHQADQYCQHVGKRLPTAAEWDMAADYEGFPSLGEAMGRSDDTLEVGSTGDVSPEGVHNLGDNVVEWVADSYEFNSSEKVVKGYSFYSYSVDQKSRSPDSQDWGIGFRCAADIQ